MLENKTKEKIIDKTIANTLKEKEANKQFSNH